MIKVITYGTFDLLHYGHLRLLERAKTLGDYLIVGVTSDDFDRKRGKINNQQSLIERIEAVRATGLANEIIVEEYEGQKIDDIRRYGADIFTLGSDWEGKFDYLKAFCKVIYLPRTEGISSSALRESRRTIIMGLAGDGQFLNKIEAESRHVNGLSITSIYTPSLQIMSAAIKGLPHIAEDYDDLLSHVDAVYIRSRPASHYKYIKRALECGKHVLCEVPMTLDAAGHAELVAMAKEQKLVLMDALKTAYATAYARLQLLVKSGAIGEVLCVDATCTSLRAPNYAQAEIRRNWDGIYNWGPTALLPVFQILGTQYRDKQVIARFMDEGRKHDAFVKIDFLYPKAAASVKVGQGMKSEGELVISGTKGYIYVPAPWWKTDYFEVRYENPMENKRYFYPLDGEGIRYELVTFVKAIESGGDGAAYVDRETSRAFAELLGEFYNRKGIRYI